MLSRSLPASSWNLGAAHSMMSCFGADEPNRIGVKLHWEVLKVAFRWLKGRPALT